jgi:Tol biopolymer transport system component
MGEVYRGKDTRLDRMVAVKVLPSHLSFDPDLKARFEREAKAISQLTHPHICTLYDVGNADGVEYLVMELLEGQTLAERLEKGPLPTEQVMRFGVEIADALDKAHRAGIVHRDLKPGNVMLTKSGVKLLDFGLAKAVAASSADVPVSSLPTEAERPLTERGTILGTFQYMAPEQLEGKEADPRSDIFAFGCVLYEMATAKKAFTGGSRVSLISSILRDDPRPISSVAPMTPPALDRVVKNCLAKDPEDRWQSAHDVMSELRWIGEAGSQAGAPAIVASKRKNRERLAWICAAAAAIAAVVFAFGWARGSPRPAKPIFATLPTPEKTFVDTVALSPDGTHVAFTAVKNGEQTALWVRTLSEPAAQLVTGSEEAEFPFWSPDGRNIAFFSHGALKRVDLNGGPVLQICDAERGVGGTWNRDGVIVFAPAPTSALFRVSASGGRPVPVTKLDAGRHETAHRYPSFLPDGRRFLFMAGNPTLPPSDPANAVRVGSLDGKTDKEIVPLASNAVYASGYLFYSRQTALLAQRFDPGRLAAEGDPVPIAPRNLNGTNWFGYFPFAASQDLVLYLPFAGILQQMAWFDRSGREIRAVGEPRNLFGSPRLSPDGRRVAVSVFDAGRNHAEAWLFDAETGAGTRFAYGDWDDFGAVWSPPGDRIAFGSNRRSKGGNRIDLWTKALDGSAEEILVESPDNRTPDDWSPDGRFIAVNEVPAQGNRTTQIWAFDAQKREAAPFETEGPASQDSRFSPDGKWIAYDSIVSGRFEVYVKPFPGPGPRHQISTDGGSNPAWSRDGKEIYYLTLDNRLMAVPVDPGSAFHAGAPVQLFAIHAGAAGATFEVARDGQKFFVASALSDQGSLPFSLVVHWNGLVGKN